MSHGIELIAETESDKEILNIFHKKGVRTTGYDITKHKMTIEKRLERPMIDVM